MTNIPFELDALKDAHNYQRWAIDVVEPFLGNRILEVGAGIGNLSQHIPVRELFVASEAEPGLLQILSDRMDVKRGLLPKDASGKLEARALDLSKPLVESLRDYNFDTIVSFNVLEHVEDDAAAFRGLVDLLRASKAPGPKRIISLVPAHAWAFGSIDKTYGHYRRYTAKSFHKMLERAAGNNQGSFQAFYFNIVGLIGWLLYNRVLKVKNIPEHSIKSVEKLCPLMQLIDFVCRRILRLPGGQSLVTVFTI